MTRRRVGVHRAALVLREGRGSHCLRARAANPLTSPCFELSNDAYPRGLVPTLFDAAWGNPAWPHVKAFPAGQTTHDGGLETSPYRLGASPLATASR